MVAKSWVGVGDGVVAEDADGVGVGELDGLDEAASAERALGGT